MKKVNTYYKRLRNDEFFDEVHIKIVPRFKTSDMSGDEWRTSARLQFFRKGELVFERGVSTMEVAAAFLPYLLITVLENGEYDEPKDSHKCTQPGCSKTATVELRMKQQYHDGDILPDHGMEYRCKFCDEHAHRGDADYNDRDENYELIEGSSPNRENIPDNVISQARQVTVDLRHIDASDQDALGKALNDTIQEVRKSRD